MEIAIIISKIVMWYIAGYIICLMCFIFDPVDDPKASDVKSKFIWGLFFSIVWPISMWIILVCIIARIYNYILDMCND